MVPYSIDYQDPIFPSIKKTDRGVSLGDAKTFLIRHHMQAIRTHLRAMERALDEVQDQDDTGYSEQPRD